LVFHSDGLRRRPTAKGCFRDGAVAQLIEDKHESRRGIGGHRVREVDFLRIARRWRMTHIGCVEGAMSSVVAQGRKEFLR